MYATGNFGPNENGIQQPPEYLDYPGPPSAKASFVVLPKPNCSNVVGIRRLGDILAPLVQRNAV